MLTVVGFQEGKQWQQRGGHAPVRIYPTPDRSRRVEPQREEVKRASSRRRAGARRQAQQTPVADVCMHIQ